MSRLHACKARPGQQNLTVAPFAMEMLRRRLMYRQRMLILLRGGPKTLAWPGTRPANEMRMSGVGRMCRVGQPFGCLPRQHPDRHCPSLARVSGWQRRAFCSAASRATQLRVARLQQQRNAIDGLRGSLPLSSAPLACSRPLFCAQALASSHNDQGARSLWGRTCDLLLARSPHVSFERRSGPHVVQAHTSLQHVASCLHIAQAAATFQCIS